MRVGSDIDDVMVDWYWTADTYATKAGLNPKRIKPSLWACHEEYGCTLEEWYAAVYPMALDGYYLDAVPFPGVVEALKKIKDADSRNEVHLITSRGAFVHGDRIKADTLLWVEKWFPFVDSVTFSSDKTQPRTDIFIDDLTKNVNAVNKAGILGVLHTQVWNKDETGYFRVDNLDQFADLVLDLGASRGPLSRSKVRRLLSV